MWTLVGVMDLAYCRAFVLLGQVVGGLSQTFMYREDL